MIVLNNSSTNTNISRLSVTRGHVKTTNEMQAVTAFGDLVTATNALTINALKLTPTNGVTNVDIVASNSSSGQVRQVMQVTITNNDTVSDTVNIFVGDTNTPTYTQIYGPITLPSGYSLCYDHGDGWYVTDANGMRASGPPSAALGSVITVAYQQPSGTAGGNATAGAWTKYPLNTIFQNDLGISAISSNQFVLPAGTYICNSSLIFLATGSQNSKIRLFNVTDSTTTLNSVDSYSNGTFNCHLQEGVKFTITAPKTFEIDYYIAAHVSTSDLGIAYAAPGVTETYGLFYFQKIG